MLFNLLLKGRVKNKETKDIQKKQPRLVTELYKDKDSPRIRRDSKSRSKIIGCYATAKTTGDSKLPSSIDTNDPYITEAKSRK